MSSGNSSPSPEQRQFAYNAPDSEPSGDVPSNYIPTEAEAACIPGFRGCVRRTCPWCQTEFVSQASRKKRCCSGSCAQILLRKEAKESGRVVGGRRPTGETRPCEICGKPVYVKQWQMKKGQGRFCDRDCKDKWWARNSVERPCEWCGEMFRMSPSEAKVTRFCKWECQAEGRRTRALDREHNGRRVALWNDGYIYVWEPDHPKSSTYGGWYAEHRLVMERQIGRVLETEEIVHHEDGDKTHNDPSNLRVVNDAEHQILTRDQILERRKADAIELAALRAFKAAHDAARLASDGSEAPR